jgi:hypothetical protein
MIDLFFPGSGKPDDGPKEDLNGKLLDMYSSIYTMRQDLERIKKPQGSKENPVRSCKDLYFGHPQFKDGKQKTKNSNDDFICIRWPFAKHKNVDLV